MQDDPRCCGTGHCLIDAQGHCWCGQQWDGEKMCFAKPQATASLQAMASSQASAPTPAGNPRPDGSSAST